MCVLEMPVPCSSCGHQVELNDTRADTRAQLHCKTCWPTVEVDEEWEQAADGLDRLAAAFTDWGVSYDGAPDNALPYDDERDARRQVAEFGGVVMARRMIVSPWEKR